MVDNHCCCLLLTLPELPDILVCQERICFDCHQSVGLLDILMEDMIYLLQLADIHCMMGHLDFWYNQVYRMDRLELLYNLLTVVEYMTRHWDLLCSQLVAVDYMMDH